MKLWECQQEIISELKNSLYVVVKKPRQSGFTEVALRAAHQMVQEGKTVAYFSQTKRIADQIITPRYNAIASESAERPTGQFLSLAYGELIRTKIDFLIMDEPAFADPELVEKSWWDGMTNHTPEARVLVGSTPGPMTDRNGNHNFFFDIWTRENAFVKFEWSVDEHPVLRNVDFSYATPAIMDNEVKGNFIVRSRDRENELDLEMLEDGNYVLKMPSNGVSYLARLGVVKITLTPHQLDTLATLIKNIK